MPITLTEGNAINNAYNPNQGQLDSARDVIDELQYADIWAAAGTLRDNGVMRVDMQGIIPGAPVQHNIQVQVDGVRRNSTVAHANVSVNIMSPDPGNQRGALRKVVSALKKSLYSGKSYTVAGTNP